MKPVDNVKMSDVVDFVCIVQGAGVVFVMLFVK
jgi:hypothetical protein